MKKPEALDREKDREALEEERRRTLQEVIDGDEPFAGEDGEPEVRGVDGKELNRGMKRLAEVLRKIKEETDDAKKRN